MVHVLKDESVVGGEVCQDDLAELRAFRVKTADGRYTIVLADSPESAAKHAGVKSGPARPSWH